MTATTARAYTSNVVVRWSDMDAFKHVNHARMVTLLALLSNRARHRPR